MQKKFNNRQTPLGIIAILAGLAETFSTIVLKFLPLEIQRIFVWFVMFFPILLVILFFIVLYKKPKNFYSPYDYRSDESFLNDNSNNITINQLDYTSSIIAHNEELTNTQKEKMQKSIENFQNEIIKENTLKISINNTLIEANTVKSFYRKIFDYLTENKIDFKHLVPFKTSDSRYLISEKSVHPSGAEFWAPLIYKNYYIETNKNKVGAKKDIIKFLSKLNLKIK